MGGGMKAGVNIWRALRHNSVVHPAWRHLADKPLTEADLPRAIEAMGTLNTQPTSVAVGKGDNATAAIRDAEVLKPIARKVTIEVKAFTEQQEQEMSDDQRADLAH
eukprot:GHUV01024854.1.p2 GENE.GHUV01024854.1~~GHUV01024854.1.p2  ORF type:complete len:106 (+),score=42.30 GHUV01024854.1:689-1006(+)